MKSADVDQDEKRADGENCNDRPVIRIASAHLTRETVTIVSTTLIAPTAKRTIVAEFGVALYFARVTIWENAAHVVETIVNDRRFCYRIVR